jgi:hypothetical protein
MKQITVYTTEAAYGRNAYLKLVDGKVIFDCSDEEYGPIEFDLELLEKCIKEYKNI